MDSATDFVHDDGEDDVAGDSAYRGQQTDRSANSSQAPTPKPVRQRLTTKSSSENSLQVLDACLPKEPPLAPAVTPTSRFGRDYGGLPPWLKQALLGGGDHSDDLTRAVGSTAALTARLPALAQRMRSLLAKGVYARRTYGKGGVAGWADAGRPAGFVGAGLAEELCLAVFGRIQALRAKGVGKQVRGVFFVYFVL